MSAVRASVSPMKRSLAAGGGVAILFVLVKLRWEESESYPRNGC